MNDPISDLVLKYAQYHGEVKRSFDKTFRFHASLKHGCVVRVPDREFDRMVRAGEIDKDGKLLDEGANDAG